jgi:hypothetical protein
MGEPESNIPNALQVDLFDESMLPAGRELLSLDQDEKRGRSTGERLARNREMRSFLRQGAHLTHVPF